jgi:hypothetical protein
MPTNNNMYVEVSIPSNYKTDLKSPSRNMSVYGWYQEENPDNRWRKSMFGVYLPGNSNHWLETATLVGTLGDEKELSVVVTTNGASWFANKCYVDHEEAERVALSIRSQYQYAWAVRVSKLT